MILPTHIVAAGGIITNDKNETLSEESIEVKWFTKEEALKMVNSKQQYRFKKTLDYKSGFNCAEFYVNSQDQIEVYEEYLFDR